jgi:hypothetical protein
MIWAHMICGRGRRCLTHRRGFFRGCVGTSRGATLARPFGAGSGFCGSFLSTRSTAALSRLFVQRFEIHVAFGGIALSLGSHSGDFFEDIFDHGLLWLVFIQA